MRTRPKKIRYKTLDELIRRELHNDDGEDPKTAVLIENIRHIRLSKEITRTEFLAICRWKSPRAVRHFSKNKTKSIQRAVCAALSTRNERQRLEYLTALKGVNVPMASAILMLTDPKRYGVIDIRVWQLLHRMRSVSTKENGVGFTFKNWYHYLCKLRYFAKKFGVSARTVERTLFRYHKVVQKGNLYRVAATPIRQMKGNTAKRSASR